MINGAIDVIMLYMTVNLDQIKEMGELPFRTVIKAERYGNGGTKYIFT